MKGSECTYCSVTISTSVRVWSHWWLPSWGLVLKRRWLCFLKLFASVFKYLSSPTCFFLLFWYWFRGVFHCCQGRSTRELAPWPPKICYFMYFKMWVLSSSLWKLTTWCTWFFPELPSSFKEAAAIPGWFVGCPLTFLLQTALQSGWLVCGLTAPERGWPFLPQWGYSLRFSW